MNDLECIAVLYYDVENNYFVDEMGFVVYDIFNYITPNDLYLFKDEKEDLFILKGNRSYVEIIFPEYLPY